LESSTQDKLMNLITLLNSYVAVVEKHSFTAAARHLNLSVAQVSKNISWLEEELNTVLVQRSTRFVTPTDAGKLFLSHSREVLAEWDKAKNSLECLQKIPQGNLAISVPMQSFGISYIATNIPKFLRRYPRLHVDLQFESPQQTEIVHSIDIAIRIGELKGNENFHAIKVGLLTKGVFATPDYLKHHGCPQTPENLAQHNCIVFLGRKPTNTWLFKNNQKMVVSGNYSTNNVYALREAINQGMGLGWMSHHWTREDVASGKLVEVLAPYVQPGEPIYLIYKHQSPLPLAIQCFINFVKEIIV
jgi:DNA-binding transcriptional LysR family regulator